MDKTYTVSWIYRGIATFMSELNTKEAAGMFLALASVAGVENLSVSSAVKA